MAQERDLVPQAGESSHSSPRVMPRRNAEEVRQRPLESIAEHERVSRRAEATRGPSCAARRATRGRADAGSDHTTSAFRREQQPAGRERPSRASRR
jgi:hypothetical protein